MAKKTLNSTQIRIEIANKIYRKYCRTGLTNREIFRRYVQPLLGICEKTFYDYLKKGE